MAAVSSTERPLRPSDRVVKEVPEPPMFPMTSAELFSKPGGLPDLARLKEHFLREAVFASEPNVLELKYPITVCGDVHGQYFDLVRLFEIGGDPSETPYLFLGDYVDRGCFSCECVLYLYAIKLSYPKTFFMLRGNHECRQLTAFFNFKDECTYKYNQDFYERVMRSFDVLPLVAIVNKSFFCVHGGLSPDIATVNEVRALDRRREIPREGPMCDLLWSDPYESEPAAADLAAEDQDDGWFAHNQTRQCSFVFGVEAVKKFLKENKFTSIIRAHEAQVDGYKMHMLNKSSGIPRVITIFSAPNYCDVYNNKAACLKFDTNILNIKQFNDSVHPYYLPNFMDVFQWSLPFVAEKVCDMLHGLLLVPDVEPEDPQQQQQASNLVQRSGLLKKKVLAMSKLLRMYKVLRVESENIVKLKELAPGNKVPFGLLGQGHDAIEEALSKFENAAKLDKPNEAMPTPAALERQASLKTLPSYKKLPFL